MSDFLSQFEKNNYKKDAMEENIASVKKEKSDIKEIIEGSKEKVKHLNPKDMDNEEGMSSFHSEVHHGIESPEHVTEVDTKYHKRKVISYIIISITVVIVSLIVLLIIRLSSQITLKDFVGTNINEAKTWGLKNKIEIETEEEYSLEQDENIIISQDREVKSKIQKGNVLRLKVSKGADPDEKIELPDFTVMTAGQIQNWMEQNKLRSIALTYEFNVEIEKNRVIRTEFRKDGVDASNFKRKDGMNIYISKGVEILEKNITVPDFSGKSKTEVDTWANTNEISVQYTESGSDKVMEGLVVSQDIEAGSKVAKKDAIKIVISLGKGVAVPDFSQYTKEEATTAVSGLLVNVKTKYSTNVSYGKLISQSVKKGVKLYGADKQVEVIYSEGRPYIDDLIGKTEKDIAPYFYNFTSKGANLTYSVEYIDSTEKKGTVVWASKLDEFVGMNEHVVVHISTGNPPSNP